MISRLVNCSLFCSNSGFFSKFGIIACQSLERHRFFSFSFIQSLSFIGSQLDFLLISLIILVE